MLTTLLASCSSPEPAKSRSARKHSASTSKAASRNTGQVKAPEATGVALLVVDVQQDFFDSQTELANPEFVTNIRNALKSCRDQGIEVIHVRTAFSPDIEDRSPAFRKLFGEKIPCVIGTPGVKALECAQQTAGEKVFYKTSFDPFENAELVEHLGQKKIGKILVCGLTTDVCVLSTCFSSTNKGFLTTLVEDCCAAGQPMAHQFVVNRYRGMIFDTINSSEIASRIRQNASKPESKSPTKP